MKRNILKGISAMVVLIFIGCATAPPKPVTIRHRDAQSQRSAAVSSKQGQKEAADGNSSELLDLLKKKNVISADEADRFTKERGTAISSEENAALVELLKKKNVISADEAAQFIKKTEIPAVQEKASVVVKKDNKEQNEKIPATVNEDMKKDTPEPVKNDEHKEAASDSVKVEKEQKENIPVSSRKPVENEEQKDVSPEAVKGDQEQKEEDILEILKKDEQKDVSAEAVKEDHEQNEKTPSSINEEMKKDISEPVKKDEPKDVSQKGAINDQELNEITAAGIVGEGMKKDTAEPINNEEQKDVLPEAAKSDKEKKDKIPASISEELKKNIQEQVKEEITKEIKKLDLAAVIPEWIKRIRFDGDLRLRYEHDQYDQNNGYYVKPDNPSYLLMDTTDHDYFRYRARIGATLPVNDKVDVVLRLSTGNDSNPTSTNSTMGDYMNRDRVYFDLAYLKWQPWKFFTLEGGRIPNPWFYSDLVWSPNLNFEGVALKFNQPVSAAWTTFLTVGAFPLQQYDFSSSSKYLTAGQLVLERKQQKGISARIGTAYYYFSNITGVRNDPFNITTDWTAPLYQQKGNTIFNIDNSGSYKFALASEFREFNVTANLDIGIWDPVHIVFLGDYVRNLGFDLSDVIQRTGRPNAGDVDGYQIGVSVGYPKIQEFGQWKTYLYYKSLGADAVVDAFTDSDFHLGGTDAKGWIVGGDLGLSKNIWLSARWLTANEIHGNPFSTSMFTYGGPLAIDVFQLDLNVRF